MALNENIIKNIANEVSRSQARVEPDFVAFVIDLLLLDPKYGKLFSKTVTRKNLQYFVEQCVEIVSREDTPLHTLKIQYIMHTNYDTPQNLIDKNLESISNCLRPLLTEILEEEPVTEDEAGCKKLFRKISIYIVLASGLGNPGVIATLKEGMAALESVFSMEDLRLFVGLPRDEKLEQLQDLVEIVSGVRLFNRDCKKGGEGIPDLPFSLVDASRACVASLSGTLVTVMQRVNTLTTAIEDLVHIQDETGNVYVEARDSGLTDDDLRSVLQLLAFYRQRELLARQLLSAAESLADQARVLADATRDALEQLHTAVKYKAAVPVATVYVVSDQERMTAAVPLEQRLFLGSLRNYVTSNDSGTSDADKNVQFLGFCALCLSAGALVPSNTKLGLIRSMGRRYGFCGVGMMTTFSKDPDRYVNEVLQFARQNPYMINLLDINEDVAKVKDVDVLVTKVEPKTKVLDKDIQTEVHPVDSYIEKDYTWDMWELKRRACQWATIVKCRTHSTQTHHSHMRSEIECQTVENRDKGQQTKRDSAANTATGGHFLWGLRARIDYGQHVMDVCDPASEKKKAQVFSACTWPCVEPKAS